MGSSLVAGHLELEKGLETPCATRAARGDVPAARRDVISYALFPLSSPSLPLDLIRGSV